MAADARQDLICYLVSFLDGKLAVRDLWEQVLELLYQPPVENGRLAWAVWKLEGALLEYFDRFISMDELRREVAEALRGLNTVTVGVTDPQPILTGSAANDVSFRAEMSAGRTIRHSFFGRLNWAPS